MTELTPAPVVKALAGGATLIVLPMVPQPKEYQDGSTHWMWNCGEFESIEKQMFNWIDIVDPEILKYSPLGHPGDVLVSCRVCHGIGAYSFPEASSTDGSDGWYTCDRCDGANKFRLTVRSVAVKQLGDLDDEDFERTLEHPMDFVEFYNSYAPPGYEWAPERWVWVVEVDR